jgi:hypothetical protein
MNDLNDWDRRIIEEFRANGGNVGGPFTGVPLLLLTTTGAKSGEPRIRPLAYLSEGGHIYVFAGNRARQPIPIGITTWSRILMWLSSSALRSSRPEPPS